MTKSTEELLMIAQALAEQHMESYDFINVAEQQEALELTDDELEDVWQMVTEATVEVYRVL